MLSSPDSISQKERIPSEIPPVLYREENGERVGYPNPDYEPVLSAARYNAAFRFSGIPLEYVSLDFDNVEDKYVESRESFLLCKKYAMECRQESTQGISLYLHGALNRSGKTTMQAAIGKEFLRQGFTVKYYQAGDLALKLINFDTYHTVMEEARRADLILLNDAFDPNKSLMWGRDKKPMIVSAWDTFVRSLMQDTKRFVIDGNVALAKVKESYSLSLYELLDTNCKQLEFLDSVKSARKMRVSEFKL